MNKKFLKFSEHIQLNSGFKIPRIGLGTSKNEDPETMKENIRFAVMEAGYRHIDTASIYKNEEQIGNALESLFNIKKAPQRSELFITTKIYNHEKYADTVIDRLKSQLNKLRTNYVDLYLIHWPLPDFNLKKKTVRGDPTHKVTKIINNIY